MEAVRECGHAALASYPGRIPQRGSLAIQTTIRNAQISCVQVSEQLRLLETPGCLWGAEQSTPHKQETAQMLIAWGRSA